MFKETYERKLNGNSLILTELDNLKGCEFEDRMILENSIRGFLACQIREEDGNRKYYYDITSKQSMFQMFEEREMKESDVSKIIKGITNIKGALEEYLLNDDHLILNPKFIFLDPETRIPSFIFYPNYEMSLKESLLQLGLFILEKTDHNDEGAVSISYGFYKMIVNEDYHFDKLLQFVGKKIEQPKCDDSKEEIKEECINEYEDYYGKIDSSDKKETIILSICAVILILIITGLCIERMVGIASIFGINEKNYLRVIALLGAITISIPAGMLISKINKEGRKDRFAEIKRNIISENNREKMNKKERLISFGKTGELSMDEMNKKRLVSYEDNQVVELCINKSPFVIGKSDKNVDGCLKNQGASRIHAKITVENGRYYITDLNSTNGTRVNGRLLEANERAKLSENDEVSFADAVFYFR